MLYRFADFNAGHYASRNVAFQSALSKPLALDDKQIRNDLERQDDAAFDETRTYTRVFALAEKSKRRDLPRAMVPQIKLQSPKITRNLTTEWFARRVDQRYDGCLARWNAAGLERNAVC